MQTRIRAVFLLPVLLFGLLLLTACGGTAASTSPASTTPAITTRTYSATASVGDFLQIAIDPAASTLSYSNLTNGAAGTNIPFTVNSDGTYSFTDPANHLLMGYEVPNYALVLQVNNAGPTQASTALVFSAAQTPMVPTNFFGQKFNFMQFRTSNAGVEIGDASIAANGGLTVNTYQPGLELDTESTFTRGLKQPATYAFENLTGDNIPATANYTNFLTMTDPGAQGGTDYLFETPLGSLISDTPLGTALILPQGSPTFDSSFAGSYSLMYYKMQVTNVTAQDVEQGTVTMGTSTLTISASGTLTLTEPNNLGVMTQKWQGTLEPVASAPYLYGTGSDGLLSDPCPGLFTFRLKNGYSYVSGTPGRLDVFVTFLGGASQTMFLSTFTTPYPVTTDLVYTYRYGVAFPQVSQ